MVVLHKYTLHRELNYRRYAGIVNEHVVCAVGRPFESNEDCLLQFAQSFSAHLLQRISACALNCLSYVVVMLDAHRVHHQQHRSQHEQQEHFDGYCEHAGAA